MKADKIKVVSAFSSDESAILFALCMLCVLCLPFLTSHLRTPQSTANFDAYTSFLGDGNFLTKELDQTNSELDIVFLGSSMIWHDIDTKLVAQQLGNVIGKQAGVINLGHSWIGLDYDYFLLDKLVSKRAVKLLVMGMPPSVQLYRLAGGHFDDLPHEGSEYWFDPKERCVTDGIPPRQYVSIYANAILGAPRKLMSSVRPDLAERLDFNLASDNGGLRRLVGYKKAQFVACNPFVANTTAESLFYSRNPRAFAFENIELGPYQSHFLRKIFQVCHEKRIKLIVLHCPFLQERQRIDMTERLRWPELDPTVDILGVPPGVFFSAVASHPEQIFMDDTHLNANGSTYFTKLVLSGIIDAYKRAQ